MEKTKLLDNQPSSLVMKLYKGNSPIILSHLSILHYYFYFHEVLMKYFHIIVCTHFLKENMITI